MVGRHEREGSRVEAAVGLPTRRRRLKLLPDERQHNAEGYIYTMRWTTHHQPPNVHRPPVSTRPVSIKFIARDWQLGMVEPPPVIRAVKSNSSVELECEMCSDNDRNRVHVYSTHSVLILIALPFPPKKDTLSVYKKSITLQMEIKASLPDSQDKDTGT